MTRYHCKCLPNRIWILCTFTGWHRAIEGDYRDVYGDYNKLVASYLSIWIDSKPIVWDSSCSITDNSD